VPSQSHVSQSAKGTARELKIGAAFFRSTGADLMELVCVTNLQMNELRSEVGVRTKEIRSLIPNTSYYASRSFDHICLDRHWRRSACFYFACLLGWVLVSQMSPCRTRNFCSSKRQKADTRWIGAYLSAGHRLAIRYASSIPRIADLRRSVAS